MISEHQMQLLRKYCREPIQNIKGYKEALNTNGRYVCHHINELTFTMPELIKMNMYYNRPASELILLTASEHSKLHRRQGMPSALYGSKNPMYGRTGDKHPMYGKGELRTGDKNPNWKGENASKQAKYMREYNAKKRAIKVEEVLR